MHGVVIGPTTAIQTRIHSRAYSPPKQQRMLTGERHCRNMYVSVCARCVCVITSTLVRKASTGSKISCSRGKSVLFSSVIASLFGRRSDRHSSVYTYYTLSNALSRKICSRPSSSGKIFRNLMYRQYTDGEFDIYSTQKSILSKALSEESSRVSHNSVRNCPPLWYETGKISWVYGQRKKPYPTQLTKQFDQYTHIFEQNNMQSWEFRH